VSLTLGVYAIGSALHVMALLFGGVTLILCLTRWALLSILEVILKVVMTVYVINLALKLIVISAINYYLGNNKVNCNKLIKIIVHNQLTIGLFILIFASNCLPVFGSQLPKIINISVPPNAYELVYNYNEKKNVKFLSYKIAVDYPAKEIIDFYNSEFISKDWKITSSNGNTWESFIDSTIKGNPMVSQFSVSYINVPIHAKAMLVLKYLSINNNELYVTCQIQPLIYEIESNRFIKRLEDMGEFTKFMNLLNKYRNVNGDIDTEKAINENKNNELLKEYNKIIELENDSITKSKLFYR